MKIGFYGMKTALLIFIAAFANVGLGCFQTINVINGWHWYTALTSIAQSTAALTLYKYAPRADSSLTVVLFVLGGVAGGQLSLLVSKRRRS